MLTVDQAIAQLEESSGNASQLHLTWQELIRQFRGAEGIGRIRQWREEHLELFRDVECRTAESVMR